MSSTMRQCGRARTAPGCCPGFERLLVWPVIEGPALAIVAMVLCLAPGGARAEQLGDIALDVEAPAACPADGDDVRAEAVRLLPADGVYEPIAVRLVVTEREEDYRVELTARGPGREAERVLAVGTCDKLVPTLALLLALTIDPTAVAMEEQTPQPPQASIAEEAPAPPRPVGSGLSAGAVPPDKPAPEPAPIAAPMPASRTTEQLHRSPVRVSFGLSGRAHAGAFPTVALGPVVTVGVDFSRFSTTVSGQWLLAPQSTIPDPAGAAIDGSLRVGELAACYLAFGHGAWSWAPCALVSAGEYVAASSGIERPRTDRTAWLAGALSVGVAFAVARSLSLEGSLGVEVPFTRPELTLRDVGTVHRVPATTIHVTVGARFRLLANGD